MAVLVALVLVAAAGLITYLALDAARHAE